MSTAAAAAAAKAGPGPTLAMKIHVVRKPGVASPAGIAWAAHSVAARARAAAATAAAAAAPAAAGAVDLHSHTACTDHL